MKLLQPNLSNDMEAVDDLRKLIAEDETISELLIESVDISSLKVKSIVIDGSRIANSNFSMINIEKLHLKECVITGTDLSAAILGDSSWHILEVINSRCSGMQLQGSTVKNVVFRDSKLDLVNFRYAKLENVLFINCAVSGMDFYCATLKNVEFDDCTIMDIELSESKIINVDMTKSSLESIRGLKFMKGVSITYSQLMQLAPAMAAEIGLHVKI